MFQRTLLVSALLLLASCAKRPEAELVLWEGRIYTGDPDIGVVEAVAVSGGKVIATGSSREIYGLAGNHTRIIDLEGRFAMPGFNDAHVHLHNAIVQRLGVDAFGSRSLAEFLGRVADKLEGREPGEWILGRGWDQSLWPEERLPTREDLDRVTTAHPVLVQRADGHSAVLNSRALEMAGFGPDAPDPPGGEIHRDDEGRPTGIITERAIEHVKQRIPRMTLERRKRGLELVIGEALSKGVTSVQDDSVRNADAGWDAFVALQELREAGELGLRVTEWLPFEATVEQLEAWRDQGGTDDPWLRTGLLKTNIDGSGGSLTAAMLEPYSTAPDNRGFLIIEPDRLEAMMVERIGRGFQIGIHTIGDRAARVVLDAFEAALEEAAPASPGRHRIEHAQFVHDDDLPRFAELGIIASMQPSHLLTDMRWAPRILGPEREHEGYRWQSFRDSGAVLAFGTDYPVEPIDPMRGLYAAVTREFEDGGPEGGWKPEERIDIEAAIDAYTRGAAFGEFEESRKGTLAPGMLADIVILSRDITRASPREILDTRVLATIVGGRLVYEAPRQLTADTP